MANFNGEVGNAQKTVTIACPLPTLSAVIVRDIFYMTQPSREFCSPLRNPIFKGHGKPTRSPGGDATVDRNVEDLVVKGLPGVGMGYQSRTGLLNVQKKSSPSKLEQIGEDDRRDAPGLVEEYVAQCCTMLHNVAQCCTAAQEARLGSKEGPSAGQHDGIAQDTHEDYAP